MALTKQQKSEILAQLVEKMQKASSIAFTKYTEVAIPDQETLRKMLREGEGELKVAKKTLIRLAAKEIWIEEIPSEALEGQIAVAFSYNEPVTWPKAIKEMAKKIKTLGLTGWIFEWKVLTQSQIQQLADIPSRDALIGQLLSVMNGPVQGFVSASSNVISGFVRVLNAHKENQEK